MLGLITVCPLNSVGTQYEEMSARGLQLPVAPARDCVVELALVEWLPKKSCEWDAPARPGRTIGSSGSRWLSGQSARNSATRTGSAAARSGAVESPPVSRAPTAAATSPSRHRVIFFFIEDELPLLSGDRESALAS
jgi:hypothetical protein